MSGGTSHFIAQRISAIAVVLLGCWFVVALAGLDSFTYLDVIRFVGSPVRAVLLVLLCLTMAYHSFLGVQVVIEDYVHEQKLRVASLLISRVFHLLVAVACIYAIVQIRNSL